MAEKKSDNSEADATLVGCLGLLALWPASALCGLASAFVYGYVTWKLYGRLVLPRMPAYPLPLPLAIGGVFVFWSAWRPRPSKDSPSLPSIFGHWASDLLIGQPIALGMGYLLSLILDWYWPVSAGG
jgi:hypothetical protein